jgi:TatD DNase family protein
LVIHCREAWDDVLKILAAHGAPDRVVMHCFSGDAEVVRMCAEQGWYVSFAGNLTFDNAQPLRDAAAVAPLELTLTETDSPYLTPHPHRGGLNDPSYVTYTLRALAEIHGRPVDQVADTVLSNADPKRTFLSLLPAGTLPV